MRFLPTRVHGGIDYLWGALMVASPYALGFADGGRATAVAFIFGLGAIAYSLLTAYELGALRLLPVPLHLILDALAGGVLALLPPLLGIRGPAAWTFVGFGLFSLLASFITETTPRFAYPNSR